MPLPASEKKRTVGSRRKLLNLSKESSSALRNLMMTKHAKDGCGMPSLKTRIPVTFGPDPFYELGRNLTMSLNDELAFIPKSQMITPAILSFYLMRCFSWYGYHAGIVDEMPAVNCAQYALPGWIALIFRAHAKVKENGFVVSFQVNGMSDAVLDALSALEGLGDFDHSTVPVVVSSDPELDFSYGLTVTGSNAVGMFDRVSALISGLSDVVTCDRIPKSGAGECYSNTASMVRSTPPPLASLRLFVAPSSVVFHGSTTNLVDSPFLTVPMAKGVWSPSEHLAHRFHSVGLSDHLAPRTYYLNMSWVSLTVADFLIAAGFSDPAKFWPTFKTMYIQAVVYLFSGAPYYVRNAINQFNAKINSGYKSLSHAKIKVPSSIVTMQRPGYYLEHGNPVFAIPVSDTVNWTALTGSRVFADYTGFQGTFNQFYFVGNADLTAPWDVTAPTNPPGLPINLIPEMQTYVDTAGFRLYSNPNPKVAKCLCFAVVANSGDAEVEAGVDIKYRLVEAVFCDAEMSPITCCWMSAGVLLHRYDKPITKHLMVFGNSGNVIRDLNEAAVLDPVKAVAVGQAKDVGGSYLQVTLDQFAGALGSTLETLNRSEVKTMVTSYLDNLSHSVPAPTWDQIHNLMTGTTPLSAALPILGGAALHYGNRFWREMNGNIRVRRDL